MTLLDFTPQRERARHAALVERARRASPARPFLLLCPREALATALETRVARAGGAAMRVLGWDGLCDLLEDALDLPPVPPAPETARAALVESALERSAAGEPGLAGALAVDAYGVALAALGVLDELRGAGWSGDQSVVDAAVPAGAPAAAALVRGHLELLGEWIRALESGLREAGQADLPLRLARVVASPVLPREAPEELFVEGVDRLDALQRGALEKLAARGTRVDVAPWVHGWRGRGARPVEPPSPPRTALEAFGRGLGHTAPGDDDSVVELQARDPDDEADAVARWLAALPERERARAVVMVPRESGYAPRVLRALERHGLSGAYACTEPVRCAPLWQVVRASIRLAWLGADAVELATVLSAPGAGIWGADRDRLCARLRERVPTSWAAVREEIEAATDPARLLSPESPGAAGAAPSPPAAPDPERVRQLLEARERVSELIALWESAGPIARRTAGERLAVLTAAVRATLARFANPVRFRESFDGARVSARWVAAANAIRAAFDTVLARLERGAPALPAHDPSSVLAPVEALLGDAPDAQNRRREDAVRVLVETPFVAERPDVLLVLGFQRGRYPSPVPRPLLLGPLELEALRGAAPSVPGLLDLPDDGTRAALAERDARRALCLPSTRLVLVSPRRDARGEAVEPALCRRDLLAAYPANVAAARARAGSLPARAFARAAAPAPPTDRARLEDAAEQLGAGDPAAALATLGAPGSLCPGSRELLAARFRPDRGYGLGPLVRDRLRAAEFSPNALENLLKCRYSFLSSALLRLRDLPLARGPALSPRDHVTLALEALAQIDRAGDAAPDGAALDGAVAAAVSSRLPWAENELGGVSLLELRRTVRGFLERYLLTRAAWGLSAPAAQPGDAAEAAGESAGRSVRIPLPTWGEHAPREIAVVGDPARVERAGGEGGEAVLLELRLGRVDGLAEQREAGLGVASALLPALAEKRLGVPVDAVATVSLGRPEAAVLAREGRGGRFASAGAGAEVVARAEDLEAHREGVLARLAAALDEVAGDGGEFRPHTREERARLERVGATSCERCAARLACRFDEGGGA